MWSAEDLARESARRQGRGLGAAQVAQKVAEAARRERETRQQLNVPASRDPYAGDPEELAELWAAKHTEWRRIAALLQTTGQEAYDPAQDAQGTAWANEREARRQGARDRHAAWMKDRQDARDELRAQVLLPADTSRRLRAIATRAGLSAEQVLAQIAHHAQMHDDGTVAVEPFTPSRGEDKDR
ncbi:hypothetical protein ACWDZW_40140 [Streptomyces coeruleorubidus]|jgi:hypothetical protein|uniref:hypothetical protein n=1 Tax=Streptomyces coeruleorubidus TaxID=116188 RepID=UPI0033E196DE